MTMRRREFLQFLGYGSLVSSFPNALATKKTRTIKGIPPSKQDDLLLADGLNYDVLLKWQDPINEKERFGSNCDYIAYLPDSEKRGTLWVNHESFKPLLVSGQERNKLNIDKERTEVGGSLIRIEQGNQLWHVDKNQQANKRIDATTNIPFTLSASINGSTTAEGTLANCAGGITPWGTFLSCEENYFAFYGDYDAKSGKKIASAFEWERVYPNPPEHYGWVVEIDPRTQNSKKHVTLGRFAHESATCVLSKNGNAVVYSGDDKNDECLYKFVSDRPETLETGTLYVADTVRGKWLSMDWASEPVLQKNFDNQIEVYIHARHAARTAGCNSLRSTRRY